MNLSLAVSQLSKSHDRVLFKDINLNIQGSTKIGLIGDNGSGKSTLLKMLAGTESISDGSISWSSDTKLGFLEQEIGNNLDTASGGEKKIIKLSQLFFSDYNVLLLDEPDNHLDIDNRLWFQQLVADFEGILIVISHDRSFLRNSIQKIWLLEEEKLTEYPFSYERFSQVYGDNMAAREHLWESQEKERQRLEDMVRMFAMKAAASDAFSKMYHSMEKRYDRFLSQMVEKPPEVKSISLETGTSEQPKRKTAIHLKDLCKSYGNNHVLKNLNLHVSCGEKVAISAPNGSGKSTLLDIVSGRIKFDSGEIYLGPSLKIGYYTQEHLESLDQNCNLIEELQKAVHIDRYRALGYLKGFMFNENQINSKVKYLSGGQKSRLQLAKFLATNPDVLILDEPTNHLDLKTVIALEKFLLDYQGTLVLVSHDQELVNKVTEKNYLLNNGYLMLEN